MSHEGERKLIDVEVMKPEDDIYPEDVIYHDKDGRKVIVAEANEEGTDFFYVLDAVEFQCPVKFQEGYAPNVGVNGIYWEQLAAVLKHRFTILNEKMPHEANVKTLELLEEIKKIQAERYAKREEAGVPGTELPLPETETPPTTETITEEGFDK